MNSNILEAVRRRPSRAKGIQLATDYLDALGEGVGPASKRTAADRLVYTSGRIIRKWSGAGKQFSGEVLESPTVKNACMIFDGIISTAEEDRDGDTLLPLGAEPDPMMPLLWQHLPDEPCGKFLQLIRQTEDDVAGSFAIADIPLGRDAALLVEMGALRLSHGFQPLAFEKKKRKAGDDREPGFLIRRFAIYETSLVSVPSNAGAVIEAFSRLKLHHPWVKSWAEGLYRGRPAIARGWTKANDTAPDQYPTDSRPPEDRNKPGGPRDESLTSGVDEDQAAQVANEISEVFGIDKSRACYVHHPQQAAHFVTAHGDTSHVADAARNGLGKVRGVQQVIVEKSHPDAGTGWRQVWPTKRDHKSASARQVEREESMRTKALTKRDARTLKEAATLFQATHDHRSNGQVTTATHQAQLRDGIGYLKSVYQRILGEEPGRQEHVGSPLTPPDARSASLTAGERSKLKAAHNIAVELSDHAEMHRPGKSMMKEARGHIGGVLKEADQHVISEEPLDSAAAKLIGGLGLKRGISPAVLVSLREAVEARFATLADDMLSAPIDEVGEHWAGD
jgi:hypothetical protein